MATDKERVSMNQPGAKLLWYPLAHIPAGLEMKQKGRFPKSYPMGCIVHFTAGWSTKYKNGKEVPGAALAKAVDCIQGGIKNGFNFLCLSKDGEIVQAAPLSHWGSHAGSSAWPGLGEGVSQKLIGLEICNAGRLEKRGDKYFSWFNQEIPADEVRVIAKDNENQQRGAYQKYSGAQELALVEFMMWLKRNNPEVFSFDYVLGHDEVATPKGRKNDPGGALSMSMPKFREFLKAEYKTRYGV